MSLRIKTVNAWALVLLALALLSAGSFIVYGLQAGVRSMFILGITGALFNVLLWVYSWFGPLYSHQELRRALRYFFLENWFFICGIFLIAEGHYKTAALAIFGGMTLHILVTHKYLRRLRRRTS